MRQKNKNGGRHWRVSVCLLLTGSLVLLMLVLIFWFSAQDATKSSDLSGGISEKIARALGWLMAPGGSREELNRWSEWLETPVRKLAHFTEYMVLSVLTCLHGLVIRIAVGKRTVCYKNRREALYGFLPLLATAVIFCVCYAMTDELHQYFVPGRSCRPASSAAATSSSASAPWSTPTTASPWTWCASTPSPSASTRT